MRISTRIRNALIGVVSAAALTGGALAAAGAGVHRGTHPARAERAGLHPVYRSLGRNRRLFRS